VKRICALFLSFLFVLLLLWESAEIPVVAQSGEAVLRPEPTSLGLVPGAQGAVTILVENVQELYGLEFHLAFDPHILEVLDADPIEAGIQVEPADWWSDGFVAVNRVENASGRIDFAATLLNPALPVNGEQVVAVIRFAAKGTGVSELSIESAILSTRDAEEIAYRSQNGSIGVNLGGEAPDLNAQEVSSIAPDTGRLLLAGAAILMLIAAFGFFVYVLRRQRH
jgi:hypothetical protein